MDIMGIHIEKENGIISFWDSRYCEENTITGDLDEFEMSTPCNEFGFHVRADNVIAFNIMPKERDEKVFFSLEIYLNTRDNYMAVEFEYVKDLDAINLRKFNKYLQSLLY